VHVQWNTLHVRLLAPKTGQLLREHLRTPRGGTGFTTTIGQHARRRRLALLQRARTAGPHIHTVCESVHQREGATGVRKILGVLALDKKHGPAVVDDAAKAAIEMSMPSYRFLRRYLERRPALPT